MSLNRPEYWRYFGSTFPAAIEALRERLEERDDSDALEEGQLARTLRQAVGVLEAATRRFFRRRDGSLEIDGSGTSRLPLPYPIVSADQVAALQDVDPDEADLTAFAALISGDDTAVDSAAYVVYDGARVGDDDPRDAPAVEFLAPNQLPGTWFLTPAVWPNGPRNVTITATWGYLEEDGTTPEPILDVLARLVSLALDRPAAAAGEAPAASALLTESVEGRSYTYAGVAASHGLTLDRGIDAVLQRYTAPATVYVSRGSSRTRRRSWEG